MVKTFVNKRGEILEISRDENVLSSKSFNVDWCPTDFTYYTWNESIQSIQQSNFETMADWFDNIVHYYAFTDAVYDNMITNKSYEDFINHLCKRLDKRDKRDVFAVPISLDDSGGDYTCDIYDLNNPPEKGCNGFAWVNKADLYSKYGVEELSESLKAELKEDIRHFLKKYTAWANKNVYRYTITTTDGKVIDERGEFFLSNSFDDVFEDMKEHFNTDDVDFIPIRKLKPHDIVLPKFAAEYINNVHIDEETTPLLLLNHIKDHPHAEPELVAWLFPEEANQQLNAQQRQMLFLKACFEENNIITY